MNNGGGGIFRIIDGPDPDSRALETYFETAHNRRAEGLAGMYNIPYNQAENAQSLQDGLSWLYTQESCAILEVTTPRLENSAILKGYFDFIGSR